MVTILNSLLPLMILVGIGAALVHFGFMTNDTRKQFDKLVYWICLPALIVWALADAPAVGEAAFKLTLVLCLGTLAAAVVALVVGLVIRLPRSAIGVFIQGAFRGNLAFVGLPVIALAVDDDQAILAKAILVFAPLVILYNVLAVTALIVANNKIDRRLPQMIFKSMVYNPLLIACVVGLVLWLLPIKYPVAMLTSLDLLGRPAGPLALISLGGAIVAYSVKEQIIPAIIASLLKVAATPALVYLIAKMLNLPDEDLLIAMIFAACPTAVASFVLATQLKGDPAIAASNIVVATLLSGVSLAVVLAMFG